MEKKETDMERKAPTAIRHLRSEASHLTYLVQVFDSQVVTTVTSSPAAARRWVHHVRYNHKRRMRSGHLVVGLADQWRRPSSSVAAVLQLCVGHRCLVFQLARCPDLPEALRSFLDDGRVSFASVGAAESACRLGCRGLRVANLREVRRLAAFKYGGDWKDTAMESVAHLVLAHRLVRRGGAVDRSDWESPVLTTEQVLYACVDAYVAFRLGLALLLPD